MRKNMLKTLAVILATGAAGCQNTAGPEESAVMHVAATGDAEVSSSQSLQPEGSNSSSLASSAEGRVDFTARVYLQNSTGSWINLTEGAAQSVSLDASGRGGVTTFHSQSIDAGSYTRARIVFEHVAAELTGEIQIGVGELISGKVQVNVGSDGETIVEREIDLQAGVGAESSVVIDLNTKAWLSRVDRQSRSVGEADFQNSVRIMTR